MSVRYGNVYRRYHGLKSWTNDACAWQCLRGRTGACVRVASSRVRVCAHACVRACGRIRAPLHPEPSVTVCERSNQAHWFACVCVCAWVRACVRAGMCVLQRVCARAHACVFVCACVCAYVYVCVRTRARACAHARVCVGASTLQPALSLRV